MLASITAQGLLASVTTFQTAPLAYIKDWLQALASVVPGVISPHLNSIRTGKNLCQEGWVHAVAIIMHCPSSLPLKESCAA